MDETRIQALIDELDGLAPFEGAVVRLDDAVAENDDVRTLQVEGNRAGYLQLGLVFLRAAFAPSAAAAGVAGDEIYVDLPDVTDEGSTLHLGEFRRWENPPTRVDGPDSWGQLAAQLGCLAVLGIVLLLILIGLYQVVGSFFPFSRGGVR